MPRSGTASERGESDPLPRRERGKGRKGGERRCSSLHRRVGVAEEVARIRREIQATRAESERARANWEEYLRDSRARTAQRLSTGLGRPSVLASIGIKEEAGTDDGEDDDMEDAEGPAQGTGDATRSSATAARNPTPSHPYDSPLGGG